MNDDTHDYTEEYIRIYNKHKKLIMCVALILAFIAGFLVRSCTSVSKSEYQYLKAHCERLEQSAGTPSPIMTPVASVSPTVEPTQTPTPTQYPNTNTQQSTYSQNEVQTSGVITKDYKPKGKEPNWIEVISYCEVQMPKVIGYDASISLSEDDTKIVKTGLRYKIETDLLKLKSDKSYHKAIFIIEFENENYENFRFNSAEVDGIKFR